MKAVLQRVTQASCTVDGKITGQIGNGLCVLVGFEPGDDDAVLQKMIHKMINLRIFSDEEGKMNLNVRQAGGSVLSISQFTLYASCRKGNRPSFTDAAPADQAKALYERFNALLEQEIHVETGIFQADMKIALVNDGPVTIILDSKEVCK